LLSIQSNRALASSIGTRNGRDLKNLLELEDKKETLGLCTACIEGKAHKEPSPRMKETSSKEVLDLIHSDVCGPLSHKTFGGARCFVTFIDDKSRKVWVHTLKRKSDVFTIFKELTAFVETETGNKIKHCVQYGGEYTTLEFQEY